MEALLKAFGSQKAIADTLGVTESAVSQWFRAGKVPAVRALELVRLTKGAIKLKDIIGE